MTVFYNMSIDRADKPWIGDRRFTEYTIADGRARRRVHMIATVAVALLTVTAPASAAASQRIGVYRAV